MDASPSMRPHRKVRAAALLLAALPLLPGCASMGPGTVARDRIDYDHAITTSWKRQMLLNLVKLRYADAPMFVDVSSIINSYVLEGQVSLGASWATGVTGGTNSQILGGLGHYADKPTITYNPLLGERFTRSLMTPVSPAVVISLLQAGWPADAVFRLLVTSANGVQNRFGGGVRARGGDPEFYRMIAGLRKIQASGAVGMRVDRVNEREATVLTMARKGIDDEVRKEILEVREILGLRADAPEFRVSYGSTPRDDAELALITRSMLEILLDQAYGIEVPEVHVGERRVPATVTYEAEKELGIGPMIRIRSGPDEPADAFVAVPYKDHWFWIDDRDYPSKRIFSFLLVMFSLMDTGPARGAPIVTIPAG